MLSPPTATCAGTGFRFGKLNVQPVVSSVATNSYFTSVLSPFSVIVVIDHFPATSASEIAAGGGGVGAAVEAGAASAVVSLACCCSDLAQPTRTTAAQQQETTWRMTPSVIEDNLYSARLHGSVRLATLASPRNRHQILQVPPFAFRRRPLILGPSPRGNPPTGSTLSQGNCQDRAGLLNWLRFLLVYVVRRNDDIGAVGRDIDVLGGAEGDGSVSDAVTPGVRVIVTHPLGASPGAVLLVGQEFVDDGRLIRARGRRRL